MPAGNSADEESQKRGRMLWSCVSIMVAADEMHMLFCASLAATFATRCSSTIVPVA